MKTWDDANRGALFRERDGMLWSGTKGSGRDYSGKLNIDGKTYWLSGWIKVSKTGRRYLSLSVQAVDRESDQGRSSDHSPRAPDPPV